MLNRVIIVALVINCGILAMQIDTYPRLTGATDPLLRLSAVTNANKLRRAGTSSGAFQRNLLYPINELELHADRRHDVGDYQGFYPTDKDIKIGQLLGKLYGFEINHGDKLLKAAPFVKFGTVGLIWTGLGLAVAATIFGVTAAVGRRSGLTETQADELSQLAYRIVGMIEKMAVKYGSDLEVPQQTVSQKL